MIIDLDAATITVSKADGLVIDSSGGMKVEHGGDITLVGDDSSPGKLICSGGSTDIEIYTSTVGGNFGIAPTVNGSSNAVLGYGGRRFASITLETMGSSNGIQFVVVKDDSPDEVTTFEMAYENVTLSNNQTDVVFSLFGGTTMGTNFNVAENNSDVIPAIGVYQHGIGDAGIGFQLHGGQGYAIGIDNSADGEPLCISTGSTDIGSNAVITITSGKDVYLADLLTVDGNINADNNIRLTDGHYIGITGSDERLEFYTDGAAALMGCDVGINTMSPGRILDCNSGGGSPIADGWSTHSLTIYKENIENASGYLDKILACPAQKWNRKPFISADEIKEAVLEEFGEIILNDEVIEAKEVVYKKQYSVWNKYFPEENSHRNKALYNMPDCDLKDWIDEWCENKRVELRPGFTWKKKRLGLVADVALTAKYLPEVISVNKKGEPIGIDTMNYIGILHNAIQELNTKVEVLENK